MKTSTPEQPKPPEPRSILLIGAPGSRKTTLAMRFSNCIKGLYIINCDQNLDGPEHQLRKIEKLGFTYGYDNVQKRDDGSMRPFNECFDVILKLCDDARTNPEINLVVLDSLTWVNEFDIQKVLTQQKRELMEGRDWAPFKTYFLHLLSAKLRGMGKTTICIVHEQPVWESDPKNMMAKNIVKYEPTIQGSVGDFFGAFFTDVWRCEARPAPMGKTESWIVVDKTPKSPDLKNSFGLPTRDIKVDNDNDFKQLWKHLEGKV